jgi:hypothetical protein
VEAAVIVATTRAALVRGVTTTDDLGDEVETDEAVPGFDDFPAAITERGRSEQDVNTGTWRTVRELVARVPADLPVLPGDRLKDLRDGHIYAIGDIERTPRGISGRSSATLTLKR